MSPDPSSMLDVSSTSQGILAPRMTTAERVAIATPANGLLVYDLDENAFCYYKATSTAWLILNSSELVRDNFVLVKSLADFPAPVAGVITLDEYTYYEINGSINLAGNSIDLNNAYVQGMDITEDVLVVGAGNTAFQGSTGGNVRNITITGGGTVFDITATATESLAFQDAIVDNMTAVGTISGLGNYFSDYVKYFGNNEGITYSDIEILLLTHQSWLEGNAGTYETFTGTFDLIEKVGGSSIVGTSATGIDVSSNPIVGEGVIVSTVFSGVGTYVNEYTTGSYPLFNFDNSWRVQCRGIPREIDEVAFGNVYITTAVETIITTVNTPVKVNGTTAVVKEFRASSPASNRIVYQGSKIRIFNVEVFVQNDENLNNITISKLNLLIY